MTKAAIPEGPGQLTDEWLTDALRGSGALDAASVSGHTWELVEMQGAAATVARVTLDYDAAEDGEPRSLVAKFATPHVPRPVVEQRAVARSEMAALPGNPRTQCLLATGARCACCCAAAGAGDIRR